MTHLPPEAVHWAKVAILDTVGCTLAGATEPCARIVDRVATGGARRRRAWSSAPTGAPGRWTRR